ncbi:glutamine synthetase family protein [Siminovitchia sediminis]|uniref:Glutamine synthetase family protein n=1 Tax=Siminovitchia sediminis TaxID=1274353 RepID=A0ABW4KHG5_9BACI
MSVNIKPQVSDNKELLTQIKEEINSRNVKMISLGIPDMDGRYKGKFLTSDYLISNAVKKGSFLCDILFGWDITDEIYSDNGLFSCWGNGFPDVYIKPDLKTFRYKPWGQNTATMIGDLYQINGELVEVAPRTVLKKMIERSEKLGYQFSFGYELEFYLFKETDQSIKEKDYRNLIPATSLMNTYGLVEIPEVQIVFDEITEYLKEYGIAVESFMYEAGEGQFEMSVNHSDPLDTADKVMLYKTAIREIAAKHGLTVSFMAKFDENMSGSSGHIHQSIMSIDSPDVNLYWDRSKQGMSSVMENVIGGLLKTLPDFTAMYCPTINSYSRLVTGSWTGVNVTWGVDNRTTALRVISTDSKSIRIENRIPGADANPYLTLAAFMASALYGIENEIDLPNRTDGDAYVQEGLTPIPLTLDKAIEVLENSEVAHLYFSEEFLNQFIYTRKWESEKFRKTVTEWEKKRYLERV